VSDSVVWRIALIAAVVIAASGVALWRRRRGADAPTQPRHLTPTQLSRVDFRDPDRDWLVVAFTSATCSTCRDIAAKVSVLESRHVAVHEVEYSSDRELHARYDIDAVPMVLIADGNGVVQWARVGPTSATDLWAALARVRDPQLPASSCAAHDHADVSE
jgi:hypothetical protein